jgi:hypothetical protein
MISSNRNHKSTTNQSTSSRNENQTPLTSKEFRNSRFDKQQQLNLDTNDNCENVIKLLQDFI